MLRRHKKGQSPPKVIEQPPVAPQLTMLADIGDFILDREAQRVSTRTIQWHRGALAKFESYCAANGIAQTARVDARTLRHYLKSLEAAGHNAGGISNLYRSVRAFLHWYANEVDLYELHATLRKIRPPTVPDEPLEPLPLDHFRALVAQCEPRTFTGERDRAILYVLLDTGIRHQELTDLQLEDVNASEGSLHIRKGKGGKGRNVFVGAKGKRILISYLRWRKQPMSATSSRHIPPLGGAKALWISDEGEPLTKAGIRQIIARLARAAGIKEPGMHMFRRAFALNSLRNGMDMITLQRLMGHSSLAIIHRYLKLVDDDLKESQGKYSVVDNL